MYDQDMEWLKSVKAIQGTSCKSKFKLPCLGKGGKKKEKGCYQVDNFKFRCLLLESTIKSHNFYSKGQRALERCTQHGIRFLIYSSWRIFYCRGFDFCLSRDLPGGTVQISIAQELVLIGTGLAFSHVSHLKWQREKQQGNKNFPDECIWEKNNAMKKLLLKVTEEWVDNKPK